MKRALFVLTAFAGVLLAVFLCGNVRAEAHEDHCICGGTTECIPMAQKYGHEGDASKGRTEVQWLEATTCAELIGYVNAARTAGDTDVYIYLADSSEPFSMNDGSLVAANAYKLHVHICLNGRTLTKTNTRIMTAWVDPESELYQTDTQSRMKLSICDCSAGKTGVVDRTGTAQSQQGAIVSLDGEARLYLYSVTLTGGTASTHSGNVSVGSGKMYMYGATVQNGTCTGSDGGNISVGSGELYMYGSTVTGGTAQKSGGNVYIGTGRMVAYESTISNGTARVSTNEGVGGNIRIAGGAETSELRLIGGKLLGGVNNKASQNTNGHSLYIGSAKVYLSKDLVMASANSASFPMTLQSGSAELYISDDVVIYKTGGNNNILQCTSANSKTYISGGTFAGGISGHQGNIYVSGGSFSSISHSYTSSKGVLQITGGNFVAKSTSAALSIPNTVWTGVENSAWIPLSRTATYTKADGTTGSFNTAYSVTSCKQITGRNMLLNENLSLGLYANVDLKEALYKDGDKVGKIVVTLNGETREASLTDLTIYDQTNNVRQFLFDGVTPELMGDEITVTLYASDGTTALDSKTYTIKEYLLGLLSGTPEAELTAIVNDLLIYGGQAQIKFNHNTSNLVSDGIAGSGRTPDGNIAVIWNDPTVTAANYQDASAVAGYFKDATVIHENTNWIRVLYKDNAKDGATTFKVQKGDGEAEDIALNGNYLCTEGLKPTEYGTKITFYAYRGGTLISKVEYSMNSYCVRKHAADGHEFSDALYNYGASALAYAAPN